MIRCTLVLLLAAACIKARVVDDRIVFPDDSALIAQDKKEFLEFDNLNLDSKFSRDLDEDLEHGKHFQGDIVLDVFQKEFLITDKPLPPKTGLINGTYRWPKNSAGNVILTYQLAPESRFSNYHKSVIQSAMDYLGKYTCVRFVERTVEKDFVYIFSGKGCYSNMGRIGDRQLLSLEKDGCFSVGTVMHEIIHALGYDHQHSHVDRDKFVDVIWRNIDEMEWSNFKVVDANKFSNFGTGYDLYSVMHYDEKAFSVNSLATIIPKNRRYQKIIGQRSRLSVNDAKRINNMYKCY